MSRRKIEAEQYIRNLAELVRLRGEMRGAKYRYWGWGSRRWYLLVFKESYERHDL